MCIKSSFDSFTIGGLLLLNLHSDLKELHDNVLYDNEQKPKMILNYITNEILQENNNV